MVTDTECVGKRSSLPEVTVANARGQVALGCGSGAFALGVLR